MQLISIWTFALSILRFYFVEAETFLEDLNSDFDISEELQLNGYSKLTLESDGSEDDAVELQIYMTNEFRSATSDPRRIWDDGIIPYKVSEKFNSKQKTMIQEAIDEFREKTCISFIPHTNETQFLVIRTGRGCGSVLGKVPGGSSQSVNLANGCFWKGILLHELMHALGFIHEHNRPDRDDFVKIVYSNIRDGKKGQFSKRSWDDIQTFNSSYDYNSVMHYGPFTFAQNRSEPTIVPLKKGEKIGQRKGFSDIDILRINKLYNCKVNESGASLRRDDDNDDDDDDEDPEPLVVHQGVNPRLNFGNAGLELIILKESQGITAKSQDYDNEDIGPIVIHPSNGILNFLNPFKGLWKQTSIPKREFNEAYLPLKNNSTLLNKINSFPYAATTIEMLPEMADESDVAFNEIFTKTEIADTQETTTNFIGDTLSPKTTEKIHASKISPISRDIKMDEQLEGRVPHLEEKGSEFNARTMQNEDNHIEEKMTLQNFATISRDIRMNEQLKGRVPHLEEKTSGFEARTVEKKDNNAEGLKINNAVFSLKSIVSEEQMNSKHVITTPEMLMDEISEPDEVLIEHLNFLTLNDIRAINADQRTNVPTIEKEATPIGLFSTAVFESAIRANDVESTTVTTEATEQLMSISTDPPIAAQKDDTHIEDIDAKERFSLKSIIPREQMTSKQEMTSPENLLDEIKAPDEVLIEHFNFLNDIMGISVDRRANIPTNENKVASMSLLLTPVLGSSINANDVESITVTTVVAEESMSFSTDPPVAAQKDVTHIEDIDTNQIFSLKSIIPRKKMASKQEMTPAEMLMDEIVAPGEVLVEHFNFLNDVMPGNVDQRTNIPTIENKVASTSLSLSPVFESASKANDVETTTVITVVAEQSMSLSTDPFIATEKDDTQIEDIDANKMFSLKSIIPRAQIASEITRPELTDEGLSSNEVLLEHLNFFELDDIMENKVEQRTNIPTIKNKAESTSLTLTTALEPVTKVNKVGITERTNVLLKDENVVIPMKDSMVMILEEDETLAIVTDKTLLNSKDGEIPSNETVIIPLEQVKVIESEKNTAIPQEGEIGIQSDLSSLISTEEKIVMPGDESMLINMDATNAIEKEDDKKISLEEVISILEDESVPTLTGEKSEVQREEILAIPTNKTMAVSTEINTPVSTKNATAFPPTVTLENLLDEDMAIPVVEIISVPVEEIGVDAIEETEISSPDLMAIPTQETSTILNDTGVSISKDGFVLATTLGTTEIPKIRKMVSATQANDTTANTMVDNIPENEMMDMIKTRAIHDKGISNDANISSDEQIETHMIMPEIKFENNFLLNEVPTMVISEITEATKAVGIKNDKRTTPGTNNVKVTTNNHGALQTTPFPLHKMLMESTPLHGNDIRGSEQNEIILSESHEALQIPALPFNEITSGIKLVLSGDIEKLKENEKIVPVNNGHKAVQIATIPLNEMITEATVIRTDSFKKSAENEMIAPPNISHEAILFNEITTDIQVHINDIEKFEENEMIVPASKSHDPLQIAAIPLNDMVTEAITIHTSDIEKLEKNDAIVLTKFSHEAFPTTPFLINENNIKTANTNIVEKLEENKNIGALPTTPFLFGKMATKATLKHANVNENIEENEVIIPANYHLSQIVREIDIDDEIVTVKDVNLDTIQEKIVREIDIEDEIVTVKDINLDMIQSLDKQSKKFHRLTIIQSLELRTAVSDPKKLWKSGIIPFVLSDKYATKQKEGILAAMKVFEDRTCVKFIERTTENSYIQIEPGERCAATIGFQIEKPNKVLLDVECYTKGTILHELMHVLGFVHEQNRPDRDQYVIIVWDNIKAGFRRMFQKYSWSEVRNFNLSYDYDSIMHYSSYEFAIDDRKPTIVALKPGTKIGQRNDLSRKDAIKIKKLYHCDDATLQPEMKTAGSILTIIEHYKKAFMEILSGFMKKIKQTVHNVRSH